MSGITKFLCLFIAVNIMTGCIPYPETRLIRLYESQLDPLMGKETDVVIPLVTSQWNFMFLRKWEGENPTMETVLEKNHHRVPFSNQEAGEVFKEKGYYDVVIYIKKGKEGSSRTWDGEDDMLLSFHDHIHSLTPYIFVRMVFRDKKLHNYRFFRIEVTG